VQDDLAQECFTALWRALTTGDVSMWALAFRAKMVSLQSHTAHACMERWGFWTRPGVVRPTRVPADVLESLEMPSDDGATSSLADQIEDPDAWRAFDRAEYAELVALLRTLDPGKRAVVYGRYWQGLSQQEIAESLGVGTRTVRWREQRALKDLRARVRLEGGSA
jgi:RNA polymerase sigma factor (sigma-70 family)